MRPVNPKTNLCKQAQEILNKYQNEGNYKPELVLDLLKQKLIAKAHRMGRYKKNQRSKQNKLFSDNQKQFYKHQESRREEPQQSEQKFSTNEHFVTFGRISGHTL